MDPTQLPIDGSDPVVIALAWGLTWAAKHYALPKRLHAYLPVLAIAIAIIGQSIAAAVGGDPVTLEVIAHGFSDGVIAVAGHSQVREMLKDPKEKPPGGSDPPTDEAS